jgi:hypothetical protein
MVSSDVQTFSSSFDNVDKLARTHFWSLLAAIAAITSAELATMLNVSSLIS